MKKKKRTATGAALSELALDLFKVTSGVLAAGDRLVAALGLTSARWQVLGTITATPTPQPVAWLARDMGANRQNVQRIVNSLVNDGFVALAPNPHHRRAPLVVITQTGREAFEQAMQREAPWMDRITKGIDLADLLAMQRVLKTLRERLQADLEDRP